MKSRAEVVDPRDDTPALEWRHEATVQELESVLWRVGLLTATAHELVEDIEVSSRSDLSRTPAVVSDARELVKVIEVHGRERELWPPSYMLFAAQVCGLGLAMYAVLVDKLTNVGLLVFAVGLLLIRRVVRARGWHV